MSRPTRGSVHNSVPNPAASAPCLSCWVSSRRCVESSPAGRPRGRRFSASSPSVLQLLVPLAHRGARDAHARSEEHTSELQSRSDLVCRLLLEKKKKKIIHSV